MRPHEVALHPRRCALLHCRLVARQGGGLSVALERRPQPVDIPADSSASAEPSPKAALQHAAAVGSPTTTAPVMDSIRRTRSTGEEGAQVRTLNPAP